MFRSNADKVACVQMSFYRQVGWTSFDSPHNSLGNMVDGCFTDSIKREYGEPPPDHYNIAAVSLWHASSKYRACLTTAPALSGLL